MASTPPALAADTLGGFRWQHRLVVVAASADTDPDLTAQRRGRERDLAGWAERALRLVEVVGDRVLVDGERSSLQAAQVRDELRLDGGAFAAALVGFDGGVKARADRAFANEELFGRVDGMPMRRQELGRRGG